MLCPTIWSTPSYTPSLYDGSKSRCLAGTLAVCCQEATLFSKSRIRTAWTGDTRKWEEMRVAETAPYSQVCLPYSKVQKCKAFNKRWDKMYDNPDTVVLSEFRIIYGSDRLRLWATLIAGLFGCNNMGVVESNLGASVVLTSQAPHWTAWRANGGPAQKLLCHKACRGRNPVDMIIQSRYYQTRQRPIWNVH